MSLASAIEQAVAATKIEPHTTRGPLEAGSWGLNGGVCTCSVRAGQGWTEVDRTRCPIHAHLEVVAVIPLREWQTLLEAARAAA